MPAWPGRRTRESVRAVRRGQSREPEGAGDCQRGRAGEAEPERVRGARVRVSEPGAGEGGGPAASRAG